MFCHFLNFGVLFLGLDREFLLVRFVLCLRAFGVSGEEFDLCFWADLVLFFFGCILEEI